MLEYVGESASVAFHRKVRDYVQSQRPRQNSLPQQFPERYNPSERVELVNADESADPNIVETPCVLGASPRSVFSNSPSSLRARLPPRHLADPLVDRFFRQVHSIFWVFPPNQFFRRLDKTYAFYDLELYGGTTRYDERDRREIEDSNWMCCVFTVLALGGFTGEGGHEVPRPSEFFSYAKSLSRLVVEDESIESIQALLLMVGPLDYVLR